jgi:hypothetical protein
MVSGIPPVGITQNERFLSCDAVLLGVRCVPPALIRKKATFYAHGAFVCCLYISKDTAVISLCSRPLAGAQITSSILTISRSQWPRGLRRRSTVARLLRSWVRIPPGAWMFVCCVCCQVEVSATDWSLIQRSPTDCCASLCVIKKPRETRRP